MSSTPDSQKKNLNQDEITRRLEDIRINVDCRASRFGRPTGVVKPQAIDRRLAQNQASNDNN